jgi:hypothetical protein
MTIHDLIRFVKKGGRAQVAVDRLTKPLAPAEFLGYQECPGREPLALFCLTDDVPGHPLGSTVSGETLKALGFAIPSYRKVDDASSNNANNDPSAI